MWSLFKETLESWTNFCPEMVRNLRSAPWVMTSLTNSLMSSVFPDTFTKKVLFRFSNKFSTYHIRLVIISKVIMILSTKRTQIRIKYRFSLSFFVALDKQHNTVCNASALSDSGTVHSMKWRAVQNRQQRPKKKSPPPALPTFFVQQR
jgi:hypothetical protein